MSVEKVWGFEKFHNKKIKELISKFLIDDIKPFLEYYRINPNSEELIYWKEREEKWKREIKKYD